MTRLLFPPPCFRAFKTVVVGGVVMKIPVEKTGKSTEVSQSRKDVGWKQL